MKLHVLLIVGFALCVTGCEKKEQADEAQTTAPAVEPMAAEKKSYQYEGFLEHMHTHADQVDEINMALADGDLDAAKGPAAWLSRHEQVDGIPSAWQPHLSGMRDAARDVENAPDLETAHAASIRITRQCQACHAAAGIIRQEIEQEDD
jgi:soluble cytochrome b562